MKLSVIICLYNTRKELFWKTLDSIYSSTLKDFEVVVVDDGSTVDYSDLIEKYHPVYVKTPNRGHLAARMYALMIARGEYVCYVDSDDTVSFNYHQPMVDKAVENNLDFVINDWASKNDTFRGYTETDVTIATDFAYEGDDILRFYSACRGRQHSIFVLWNKVIKRSLLLKAKAEIEKTDIIMKRCTYSEDMLITFFVYKHAQKMANIHTGFYFYHLHSDQSVNVTSGDKLKNQIDLITANFAVIRANIPNNKYTAEITENMREWELLMSRAHYSYAAASKDKALCDYVGEKYGAEKPRRAKYKDSSDYIVTGVLGVNFETVDRKLKEIYKKTDPVSVFYDKSDKYVSRSIDYMVEHEGKKITFSQNAEVVIPKQYVSLRTRVLHNRTVNILGNLMFKKGSKMRAFLKRHF